MQSISCEKPMPVSSRLIAHDAVDQTDCREILDACEPHVLELAEELVADHEWIGCTDAGQNRRVRDGRQDFVGHLLDDRVGVAVGHQAGERAAPCHPEPAGVVDHDQIDSAGLLALGADARAGTAAEIGSPAATFLRNRSMMARRDSGMSVPR